MFVNVTMSEYTVLSKVYMEVRHKQNQILCILEVLVIQSQNWCFMSCSAATGSYWGRPSAFANCGGQTHTEVIACDKMPNLLATRLLRAWDPFHRGSYS